jgi:coenzyme PQQ precursor peptide PqqA
LGKAFFCQINKLETNPALFEKALCLAGIRALLDTKNLNVHYFHLQAWTREPLRYKLQGQKKKGGDPSMVWTKPEFVEVRMDAEVSSYIFVAE